MLIGDLGGQWNARAARLPPTQGDECAAIATGCPGPEVVGLRMRTEGEGKPGRFFLEVRVSDQHLFAIADCQRLRLQKREETREKETGEERRGHRHWLAPG